MVGLDNRPEAEAGNPLPSFFDDQRLGAVVGHVEPYALVLADLGNLDKIYMNSGVNGLLNFNEINAISLRD